jgi:hypothetical protein
MATSIRLPIAANLDGTERIEVEGEIVYVKVWMEMIQFVCSRDRGWEVLPSLGHKSRVVSCDPGSVV